MFTLIAGLGQSVERSVKVFSRMNQNPVLIHTVLISIVLVYSLICGTVLASMERNAFHFRPITDIQQVRSCFTRELSLLVNYSRYPEYHMYREKWIGTTSQWLIRECIGNINFTSPFGEWGILSGGLFALGIVTTIGSGTITPPPVTLGGQLFCIVFGIIGIPLAMIVLANLGKHMAELYMFMRRKLLRSNWYTRCRMLTSCCGGGDKANHRKRTMQKMSIRLADGGTTAEHAATDGDANGDDEDDDDDDDDEDMGPEVVLIAFGIYVLGGSLALWIGGRSANPIESLYSTFLCLVALDFAGLAPQSSWFIPLMVIYIFTGIGITTMALDAGAIYMKKLHYLGKKIANPKNVKVTFGGKTIRVEDLIRQMAEECGVDPNKINNMDINQMVETAIENQEELRKLSTMPPIELEEVVIENHKESADTGDTETEPDEEPPKPEPEKSPTPEPSPEPETSKQLETIDSADEKSSSTASSPKDVTPIRFSFSTDDETPESPPKKEVGKMEIRRDESPVPMAQLLNIPPKLTEPPRTSGFPSEEEAKFLELSTEKAPVIEDNAPAVEEHSPSPKEPSLPPEVVEEKKSPTPKQSSPEEEEENQTPETSQAESEAPPEVQTKSPTPESKEPTPEETSKMVSEEEKSEEEEPSQKEENPPKKIDTLAVTEPIQRKRSKSVDFNVLPTIAPDIEVTTSDCDLSVDDEKKEKPKRPTGALTVAEPSRTMRRSSINVSEMKEVFDHYRARNEPVSPSSSRASSPAPKPFFPNTVRFDEIKKVFDARKKSTVGAGGPQAARPSSAGLSKAQAPPPTKPPPFRTTNFASAKAKFETASVRPDRVVGMPRRGSTHPGSPSQASTSLRK